DRNVTGVQTCALPISVSLPIEVRARVGWVAPRHELADPLSACSTGELQSARSVRDVDVGKETSLTTSSGTNPDAGSLTSDTNDRSEEHTSELQSRFDL